jgi:hypothetical protein
MDLLSIVAGWILAIFVGAAGALVLWKVVVGDIKLDKLISEPNGDASLSRFQFLIFTFIIAMSVFLLTIRQNPPSFPEIPPGILALLGISAGSYVVAKGIQVQRDTRFEQIDASKQQKIAADAAKLATGGSNGAADAAGVAAATPSVVQQP